MDVVVLFVVVGVAVTTDTESSVGVAARPIGVVIDNHVMMTMKVATAMPIARCRYVAVKVTL